MKSKTNKPKNVSSKKGGRRSAKANSSTAVTLVGNPISSPRTTITRSTGGRLRLANRELLTSVQGSAVWTINHSWLVNPGRAVFPWLSQWASSFDAYRVHKLSVEYVPVCAATTAANVQLAFDYHVQDPAPSTEQALSMTWCRTSGPCYVSNRLNVDCSRFNFSKYFTKPEGTVADVTADLGWLYCAVTGSDAVALGQLWINYDVELMEPQDKEPAPNGQMGDSSHTAIAGLAGPPTTPADWYTYPSGHVSLVPLRGDLPQGYSRKLGEAGTIVLPSDVRHFVAELFLRGVSNAGFPALSKDNILTYMSLQGVGTDSTYGHTDPNLNTVSAFAAATEGRVYTRQVYAVDPTAHHAELKPLSGATFAAAMNLLGAYLLISPLTASDYAKIVSF